MCLQRFVVERNYKTSRFCLFVAGDFFILGKSIFVRKI